MNRRGRSARQQGVKTTTSVPPAVALLVGGPLSLLLHVLWRVGHGPTVVNEHGVVLGLTNDQWSHLGWVWSASVAFGVMGICALHAGRLARTARAVVVAGLALGAASAWLWPLYSVGALVLHAGLACLAVVLARGEVLPRTATVLPALSVLVFLPVTVVPESMLAGDALPLSLQGQDVLAALTAAAWTLLGVVLLRTGRGTHPSPPVPAANPRHDRTAAHPH